MRNETLGKIALDLRLDSAAAHVVIIVAGKGRGEHEIDRAEWFRRLRTTTPLKLRHAIGLAVDCGWIRETKGGGGRPNRYEFIGESDQQDSSHSEDAQTSRIPHTLSKSDQQDSYHSDPESGSDKQDFSHSESDKQDSSHSDPSDKQDSSHSGVRVVVVEEEGSRDPPIVPPNGFELDTRTALVLEEDEFDGFRSALTDYLKARVEPSRQWGYINSVRTWFAGGPTAPRGFGQCDREKQGLALAGAFNEFLQESPLDERKGYKSARGKVGDIATLRSKVEYHLRLRNQKNGSAPSKPETFPQKSPDDDKYNF